MAERASGDGPGVGFHRDGHAVSRDGRLAREGEIGRVVRGAFLRRAACRVELRSRRGNVDPALLRIEDRRRAVGHIEHRGARRDKRGNSAGSGEYRDVRRRPAAREAQSGDARGIQRDELRGQHVVGQHDGLRRQVARRGGRRASQHSQQLTFEVAQVGGALAHARVFHGRERRRPWHA
jgi:hypothetical protein